MYSIASTILDIPFIWVEMLATMVIFWLLVYFLSRVLEPRQSNLAVVAGMVGAFVVLAACLISLSNSALLAQGDLLDSFNAGYLFVAIAMIVLYLYALIFRKGGALQKLFWIIVSYSFYLISSVASDALRLAIFESVDIVALPLPVNALFCLVTIVLMGNFLRPITRKRMRDVRMSPKVMLILALIPVISCGLLLLIYHFFANPVKLTRPDAILLFILALGIGIVVYCSFALFKTLYRQARQELRQQALIQQASLSQTHLAEITALYNETREWRHDYRNNLQLLMGYSEADDYEGMRSYLASLSTSLTKISSRYNMGDGLLNAILSAKTARAEAAGITLMVQGSPLTSSKIFEPTDLASLVGNLLDNAIEACERIKEPKESLQIEFKLFETQNELKLYEKNPTDGKVKFLNGVLVSSKKQANHGIGSGLIDSVIEKYHGYIDRKVDGNTFEVFVLLKKQEPANQNNVGAGLI